MHTLKVIAGGIALLGLVLLIGRWAGSPAAAAKLFILLWFIAAGINLWIGVSKAGYTVAEEAPGVPHGLRRAGRAGTRGVVEALSGLKGP